MTQDELDQRAAQTLHIDINVLRESDLEPIECSCDQLNCLGWRLVSKTSIPHDNAVGAPEIRPEDIVRVNCLNCSGDAYKVITRGKSSFLPVEFALCTDCAYLGVYQSDIMIPITPDLDEMLMIHYRSEYHIIKSLRMLTKRALLASRAQWN